MRLAALLSILGTVLAGEPAEKGTILGPPVTGKAKSLREQGMKAWNEAAAVVADWKAKKPVDRAAAAAALGRIEEAALHFQRCVEAEWQCDANVKLAEAVRAWHGLRAIAPPPAPPADPKESERLERARRDRLADARRLVMETANARRYENLIRRCDRCDGRKELRNAFGDDRVDCPKCRRAGSLLSVKGVLEARWFALSPLARADGRSASDLDMLLKVAGAAPQRLAPFVKSVSIAGDVEDHDTWVRMRVQEKYVEEAGSSRVGRAENVVVLYRVGRLWFLYDARADRDLVEIPAEAPAAPGNG